MYVRTISEIMMQDGNGAPEFIPIGTICEVTEDKVTFYRVAFSLQGDYYIIPVAKELVQPASMRDWLRREE